MLENEEDRAIRRSLADLQEAVGGRGVSLFACSMHACMHASQPELFICMHAADTKAIQELGNRRKKNKSIS